MLLKRAVSARSTPLGTLLGPSQDYPQHQVRRYPFIHLNGERHSESKVSCPRTQRNIHGQGSNPDRARSGDERTNHEAIGRPTLTLYPGSFWLNIKTDHSNLSMYLIYEWYQERTLSRKKKNLIFPHSESRLFKRVERTTMSNFDHVLNEVHPAIGLLKLLM